MGFIKMSVSVMRHGGRAAVRFGQVFLRSLSLTRQTPVSSVLASKITDPCWSSSRCYVTKLEGPTQSENFFLRQLFDRESCTYSYLLADAVSKDAVVIDPVIDFLERDLEIVFELGLRIKYALNTHMHSDHVTASGQLKKRLPYCKTVIAASRGTLTPCMNQSSTKYSLSPIGSACILAMITEV